MPMSGRSLKNLAKRSLSFGVPAIVLLNLLQPCLRASSAVSFSLLCLRLTCADHPAGHFLLASRHDVAPLPTWRHSGPSSSTRTVADRVCAFESRQSRTWVSAMFTTFITDEQKATGKSPDRSSASGKLSLPRICSPVHSDDRQRTVS